MTHNSNKVGNLSIRGGGGSGGSFTENNGGSNCGIFLGITGYRDIFCTPTLSPGSACSFTVTRDFESCDIEDGDANDLAACFDDVGRSNIEVL